MYDNHLSLKYNSLEIVTIRHTVHSAQSWRIVLPAYQWPFKFPRAFINVLMVWGVQGQGLYLGNLLSLEFLFGLIYFQNCYVTMYKHFWFQKRPFIYIPLLFNLIRRVFVNFLKKFQYLMTFQST